MCFKNTAICMAPYLKKAYLLWQYFFRTACAEEENKIRDRKRVREKNKEQ